MKTGPATFTPFKKLPIELRFKIWKEALPGPRLVDVAFVFETIGVRDENGDQISVPEDADEEEKYWAEYSS